MRKFAKFGGHVIICTPGRLEDMLNRKQDINLAAAVKSLVRSTLVCFLGAMLFF